MQDPKSHTEKSVAFLDTNSEQSKKDIKATIPLIIVAKRIKYLEINLTKELKDLTLKTTKYCWKKLSKV